jgi:hypothetical protein
MSLRHFAVERVQQQQTEVRQSQEELSRAKLQKAQESYADWRNARLRNSEIDRGVRNSSKGLKNGLRLRRRNEPDFIEWLKGSFKLIDETQRLSKAKQAAAQRARQEQERKEEERRKHAEKNYQQWLKSKSHQVLARNPAQNPVKKSKGPSVLAYSTNKKKLRSPSGRKAFEELSSISQMPSGGPSAEPSFYRRDG